MDGETFNGLDLQLNERLKKARDFIDAYNAIPYNDEARQTGLLTKHLGSFGQNSRILKPFYCDLATNIHIGDDVYINFNCVILDEVVVHIGNRVLIGPNVTLATISHDLDPTKRQNRNGFGLPIKIEDDAWLAAGVIVCPGVTIGKNSVVAAGSVVTKDVKPCSLYAGVPAKFIKEITAGKCGK